MDTLGVRRRCAPKLSGYTVGSLARARAMLRCPVERAGGLARLSEDVYARSTRRSRKSRIATLEKLAADAQLALVPATVECISLLAGALKAGKYRSGAGYLGILAKIHKQAGHSWSPDLEVARTDAVRSLERGLGPAKRARVVDLEAVVGRWEGIVGTLQSDVDFVIVGALWMLRGAEAAALLGDQVSIREDSSQACIALGAFKTNPAGRECTRTLRCSCGRMSTCSEVDGAGLGISTCPVHALVRVVQRRAGLGLSDKHPLFCGRGRMALTPGGARLAICRACRCDGMTEHSMRRMGAQYYARRGVPLAVIQHIGRWGSATVLRYVDQALEGRASWAPIVAAAGWSGEGVAGGGPTDRGALDSAPSVGAGSVWPAGPWGGRGRRGLGALASGPPPGGGSGSAGLRGGRGGLNLGVACPVPPPGGGLGPGGGWEPVGCPRCAGSAGACPSVADRIAIKSGATGVGHWVLPGRGELHPLAWATLCGWHFGTSPHARCCGCEISCKRCLQAASGQMGGRGGAV